MKDGTTDSAAQRQHRLSRRTLVLLGLNVAALGFLARVVHERREAHARLEACLNALARHRGLYEAARSSPAVQAELRSLETDIRARCG